MGLSGRFNSVAAVAICLMIISGTRAPAQQPAPASPQARPTSPQPDDKRPTESSEYLARPADQQALDDSPDVQGQPPTEFNQQLRVDKTDRKNWLGITPESDPLAPLMRFTDLLKQKTDLTLGGAYTMLFQQATGAPGKRSAAAGDIDLLLSWKKQFNETDYMRINSSFEYRFQIGEITPSQLGSQIGTLVPTTNGFNERPPVVKELFYDQTLADGHLRWIFGRIDPENYVGGHRLQSQNTFFLNKAFSSNPSINYPSIGLGGLAAVKPVDWFYIFAGATDVNANITRTGFDTAFDTGEVFAFAEIGGLTKIEGLGSGRQRLSLWHSDASSVKNTPSDQGISFSIDQELGPTVGAFFRAAYSNASVATVRTLIEGGLGCKGLTGIDDDYTGFALAYAAPPGSGRAETILETFQRFQIALRSELTVGAQLIINPGRQPSYGTLGVFECRFRISF